MTPDKLPHDPYIHLTATALEHSGWAVMWDTDTADGTQLDAAIEIRERVPGWPNGLVVAWDQNTGWHLIHGDRNPTVFPLPLDTYANPEDVAATVRARLTGLPDPQVTEWEKADEWEAIVTAWEAS